MKVKKDKTIYIHVGPPKTGTTTLQSFFQELSDKNEELILFPETGRFVGGESYERDDSYRGIVLESGPLDNHFIFFWKLRDKVYGENTAGLWQALRREISEFSGPTVILSSEMFWYLKEAEISQLCHELKDYRLKIVLYVRDQSKKMISIYTQCIKVGPSAGVCSGFSNFVSAKSNWICDEVEVMQKWNKYLNGKADSLTVRNFDAVLNQSSLEEDFIDNVLGIPSEILSRNSAVLHKNSRFGDHIYKTLNLINAFEYYLGCPNISRNLFYKMRDLIVKSHKIKKTLWLLKYFFRDPLVSEQEVAGLRKTIEKKIEVLPASHQSHYRDV